MSEYDIAKKSRVNNHVKRADGIVMKNKNPFLIGRVNSQEQIIKKIKEVVTRELFKETGTPIQASRKVIEDDYLKCIGDETNGI